MKDAYLRRSLTPQSRRRAERRAALTGRSIHSDMPDAAAPGAPLLAPCGRG